jgi:hypothetical protein
MTARLDIAPRPDIAPCPPADPGRLFYRRAGFVPVERELFELDLGRPTPRLT